MYVDDFVAKLAAVGLVVVAVGKGDDGASVPEPLDDEQRDELQAIIDDLNADGVNSVMFERFDLPEEAADLADWAKEFEAGNYKLDTDNMSGLLELAMDRGRGEAWSEIDRVPFPAVVVVDSLDALDWGRAIPEGRYAVTQKALAAWFGAALAKGAETTRIRGLNLADDDAVFDVPEVNAVEFILNGDEGGKVWMNVDGRCRVRFGRTTTVIVEHGGNREVLRRPADAEAPVEANNGPA